MQSLDHLLEPAVRAAAERLGLHDVQDGSGVPMPTRSYWVLQGNLPLGQRGAVRGVQVMHAVNDDEHEYLLFVPQLCMIDETGTILWTQEPPSREHMVSMPLHGTEADRQEAFNADFNAHLDRALEKMATLSTEVDPAIEKREALLEQCCRRAAQTPGVDYPQGGSPRRFPGRHVLTQQRIVPGYNAHDAVHVSMERDRELGDLLVLKPNKNLISREGEMSVMRGQPDAGLTVRVPIPALEGGNVDMPALLEAFNAGVRRAFANAREISVHPSTRVDIAEARGEQVVHAREQYL